MGPDVARRLRHHVPLLHQRTHPPAAARAAAAAAGGEAWFEADLRGRRVADVQAAYRRDGVVCLRRAFDASWIETLREIVPAALAPDNADLEQYSDGFSGEMDCARKYPTVQDFVFSSPCAELAARVIGSASLNFFYDFLFVKEPGAAARTPWHQASPGPLPPPCHQSATPDRLSLRLGQDIAYWHVEGEDIVSIWLPLDPVPRASCLEFLRGSHLHGHEYAPVKIGDGTRYEGSVGMPAIPPLEEVRSGPLG